MSSSITFYRMPAEVLKLIFHFSRYEPDDLRACCSVCKCWLLIAQPLLFEEMTLETVPQMKLVIESLKTSRRLQRYVVGFNYIPRHIPIMKRFCQVHCQVVVKCLKRMRGLERLCLRGIPFPDDLVEEICSLRNLRSLTVEPRLVDQDQVIDWPLWLELPPTLQDLQLLNPSEQLIRLLPKICRNLGGVQAASDHIKLPRNPPMLKGPPPLNETQPGLRSLTLGAEKALLNLGEWATIFKSLPTSLSGAHTYLNLTAPRGLKTGLLSKLLSSLPQLQTLHLGLHKADRRLFEGVFLRHLRSLTIKYSITGGLEEGFPIFFRAMIDFIKHSPLMTALTIAFKIYGPSLSDALIYQLISATSISENACPPTRLRFLHIDWARLSIEAFEHLCQSAHMLNHLSIDLPDDDISRIGRALGQIPCLNFLYLNNSLQREFWDGDVTKLVRYTGPTLGEFTLGSKTFKIDRSACDSDPSNQMRVRLKGLESIP